MKVLFCGLKYEYGKPQQGLSFEYRNFFEVLTRMDGVEASGFFIDEELRQEGREHANQRLLSMVKQLQPALLFCFLFTEEIKKDTIAYITRHTSTKTFNWFADDHWRFPVYSKYWAPLFTAVSTTDSRALAKYQAAGIRHVIKTQWAANPFLYQPALPAVKTHDITFVGKKYGSRGRQIEDLNRHGLPVEAFGKGWPGGVVAFPDMVEIFSHSKISLNFTDSPYVTGKDRLKLFGKLFVKKELNKYHFNGHNFIPNLRSAIGAQRRQIKARIFEIPACGGFLLTADADNLKEYYIDGREIVIFRSQQELREKCLYYLDHPTEREAIAKAGYERTIREHTYPQRFAEIFRALELAA